MSLGLRSLRVGGELAQGDQVDPGRRRHRADDETALAAEHVALGHRLTALRAMGRGVPGIRVLERASVWQVAVIVVGLRGVTR